MIVSFTSAADDRPLAEGNGIGTSTIICNSRCPDHCVVTVEVEISIHGGTAMVVTALDLQEAERFAERLRNSIAELRSALAS